MTDDELELMTKHPGLRNLIDANMRPALIAYTAYLLGVADHCQKMAERLGVTRDTLDEMAVKGSK